MRQNPAEYKGFVCAEVGGGHRRATKRKVTNPASYVLPSENEHDNEWNRYLNEMARPRMLGDQLAINAFARSYDTDVRVYQADWDFIVDAVDNPNGAPRHRLHVAYHVSNLIFSWLLVSFLENLCHCATNYNQS